MKPSTLLLLQSACITLQTINAGIAAITQNAAAALIIGAIAGGLQFYVQHAGNQVVPTSGAAPQPAKTGSALAQNADTRPPE